MSRRRRSDRSFLGRLRQRFLTGIVVILPLVITIWLLKLLFRMIHGFSTPLILRILEIIHSPLVDEPAVTEYLVPLIGVFTTLGVVVLVGALAKNLLGRQVVEGFDRLMLRIPLIKGIYGAARQLLNAFSRSSSDFRRVVAVEYPRPGVYTIGFVTKDNATMRLPDGKREIDGMTMVFLPTTPNPTSGWMAALPEDEVIPLDLSIEEGIKLIVSGGLVLPSSWERR